MAHRTVTDISNDTRWALETQRGNPVVDDYRRANALAVEYQDKSERQRREIDRLTRELAAAQKDTARLNWLETQDGRFANIDRITSVNGTFNRLPSLRAAIDEAMKS